MEIIITTKFIMFLKPANRISKKYRNTINKRNCRYNLIPSIFIVLIKNHNNIKKIDSAINLSCSFNLKISLTNLPITQNIAQENRVILLTTSKIGYLLPIANRHIKKIPKKTSFTRDK